jgi:hypothetical protein
LVVKLGLAEGSKQKTSESSSSKKQKYLAARVVTDEIAEAEK